MLVRLVFVTALGLTMAMAYTGAAGAGQIKPGDLIVVDSDLGNLDDVNPTTGVSFVIASGFNNPVGVAINAQGTIFVSEGNTAAGTTPEILAVNPTTFAVATFSGNGVGSGQALNGPQQIAFGPSGTLYVADGSTPTTAQVLAIDSNGNRSIVAGNSNFTRGLAGVAVDTTGKVFVSSTFASTIYTVSGGTATPLTTAVLDPRGLAIGANGATAGQLLAVSQSQQSISSINPTSGTTTTLSDNTSAHGGPTPAYTSLQGIAAGNGFIYVTDLAGGTPEIFKVDPTNGTRTVLAGNGVGGTTFGGLTMGIAVYPTIATAVPEPSSVALLALGATGLATYADPIRIGPESPTYTPEGYVSGILLRSGRRCSGCRARVWSM
jgi:hypothetical protein